MSLNNSPNINTLPSYDDIYINSKYEQYQKTYNFNFSFSFSFSFSFKKLVHFIYKLKYFLLLIMVVLILLGLYGIISSFTFGISFFSVMAIVLVSVMSASTRRNYLE